MVSHVSSSPQLSKDQIFRKWLWMSVMDYLLLIWNRNENHHFHFNISTLSKIHSTEWITCLPSTIFGFWNFGPTKVNVCVFSVYLTPILEFGLLLFMKFLSESILRLTVEPKYYLCLSNMPTSCVSSYL